MNDINIDQDEVGKYRKRTDSNKSKGRKKSKHKHQYKECLVRYPFKTYSGENRIFTKLTSYCEICGKIGGRLKNSIVKLPAKLISKRPEYLSNNTIDQRSRDSEK